MVNVATHLMFQGQAGDAIALYKAVFPDFCVQSIERYGTGEDGAEGTIKRAAAQFSAQQLIIIDSPTEHAFGFTPAVSLFVDFDDTHTLEKAFHELSQNGEVMMPPDDYGFSRRFAWVTDPFGVSWQLNLRDNAQG